MRARPSDDARTLTSIASQRHLPALDGLRAVAVATVMFYHYTESRYVPGDLGVTLFFVISGFLITLLLIRENDRDGAVSLRGFYARRTLRIFPAYYAYILFSLGIDVARHHPWSPGLLASALAYVMNYYNALNGHPVTSVAHAWSLADEEQFYLLWPALFLLLRRMQPANAMRWIAAVIVAVVAWRSYLYLGRGVGSAYVYNAFDTRCDSLAIGCMLAFASRTRTFSKLAGLVASHAWMPLFTIGIVYASRVLAPAEYHYSVGFTVDSALMALLIVQLMQLADSMSWSWLDHRVTRFFGVISYPLYLYHGWGLAFATHLGRQALPVTLVAATVLSVALACGSYYVVERPFLRLKKRMEERRSSPPTLLGATQP